jgi:serine/threonine protein kinase
VRVLFPEQIEELIRQPDIPTSDLSKLCDYLLTRGVLTRFQADAIRDARGQELNFAGYPIVDELGPCPGGIAFKALHPSLRTPVLLRRIRSDWLAPADNGANYVARARAYGMVHHTNAVSVLDAGFHRDELFVVLELPPGSVDLDVLSREVGGAMPGFLAAEYARAVASVLRMVHQLGGVHGDVRPANLLVGPLVVKSSPNGIDHRRPAPEAVVRLAELGLVPLRPPASQWPHDLSPYLPPERVDGGLLEPRGDIYGLGATLYFLLTGSPPLNPRSLRNF